MPEQQYDFEKEVIISLTDEYLDADRLKMDLLRISVPYKMAEEALAKYSTRDRKKPESKGVVEYNERKLAWAAEKRKLLEDALANFPPQPVLPPPPLIKLSGVLEEISVIKACACFDLGAYRTLREKMERKRKIDEFGTVAAMTAQALAGSAPHVGASDNVFKTQDSLYVKGKLSGETFSGWIETTDIQPGEYVEIAAAQDGDNYLIYGITAPERNAAFLAPKCYSRKGKDSYLRYTFVSFLLVLPLLFFLVFFSDEDPITSLEIYFGISVFLGVVTSWDIRRKDSAYWNTFQVIDEVLSLSGYKIHRLK